MRLALLRHAEAEASLVGNDAERPLTNYGQRQVEMSAAALQDYLSSVSAQKLTVINSGYVRARQTAKRLIASFNFLQEDLEPGERMQIDDSGAVANLTPESKPDEALEQLDSVLSSFDSNDEDHCLLVVTHQPLISQLIEYYLEGFKTTTSPNKAYSMPRNFAGFPMQPASAMVFEAEVFAQGCCHKVFEFHPIR